MIRIVAETIIIFLLPTLAYVVYALLTRRSSEVGPRVLEEAPFLWLFAAGAFLAVATLIAINAGGGGKPGQAYVPPELRDGHIEQGHAR
jgi:hypothetical protein